MEHWQLWDPVFNRQQGKTYQMLQIFIATPELR